MRVLITGATGFIGKAVCTRMLAAGHTIRAAIRQSGQPSTSDVEFVTVGDIDANTDWTDALAGIDVAVHLAARVHVMRDESPDPLACFRRVNTAGTERLAAQAAAAGVRRLVFLSSIKVNGEETPESADRETQFHAYRETDAPHPTDTYGASKHEAEQTLQRIASSTDLETVIIRPPLVYGPGVKGNFAAMVRWMQKGMPLPLGAVHNRRSLVALDNLVDFIALCADPERSPAAANQTFLISDGEDVSTTELLRKVANAYGVRPRLIPAPASWMRGVAGLLGKAAVADRLLGSLCVDSAKARTLLGWRPVVTMDQQLKKMADDAARA